VISDKLDIANKRINQVKTSTSLIIALVVVCLTVSTFIIVHFVHSNESASTQADEPTVKNLTEAKVSAPPSLVDPSSSDVPTDNISTKYGDTVPVPYWNPPEDILTIPALRRKVQKVGDWIYFLYPIREKLDGEELEYTALYRYREDESDMSLISNGKCDDYQIAENSVYYIRHNMFNYDGALYVSRTDGRAQEMLEEYLDIFQIAENHIYYTFSNDTVGVGNEGHALHRMDLDGRNRIIVAYRVSGVGLDAYPKEFSYGHNFYTDGKYVYGGNYKMKLGEPASGREEIVVTTLSADGYSGEWIYYTTTMLIKAKRDGSEQIILDEGQDADDDGISDSMFYISEFDSKSVWIYYRDQSLGGNYRIRVDGTKREAISRN
jgi:hypothetical protein